jgi:hypothetical protein
MNWIDVATWAAIVVLIVGSLAIFAWFAVDALRWLRAHPRVPPRRPDDDD